MPDKLLCLLLWCCCGIANGRGSFWSYKIDKGLQGSYSIFPNYLYKESYVSVSMLCSSQSATGRIRVHWILKQVHCMEQMMNYKTQTVQTVLNYVSRSQLQNKISGYDYDKDYNEDLHDNLGALPNDEPQDNKDNYETVTFQSATMQEFACSNKQFIELKDESSARYHVAHFIKDTDNSGLKEATRVDVKMRDHMINNTETDRVVDAWQNGMYHFLLLISSVDNTTVSATVRVEMRNHYGYLPANKWPLLPYSAFMSLVYLVYATVWIVMWARAHEHTFKIHMVIGAITVAGALCNTLLFVNMARLNTNGQLMETVLWLVQLLSALHDSLINLLFMVVSTGYGITRPSLGKDLISFTFTLTVFNFVSTVGLAIVIDEKLKLKYTQPMLSLVVTILYGVILLTIGAFILIMSINTLIHLWKRKHASSKLMVFGIFVLSSIVAFAVSVGMIGFSYGIYTTCRTDWQHEWLYSNFGHMESAALLAAIMWLWRPVDTWQTYAFQPLSADGDADRSGEFDLEEDEDEQVLINGEKIVLEPLSS